MCALVYWCPAVVKETRDYMAHVATNVVAEVFFIVLSLGPFPPQKKTVIINSNSKQRLTRTASDPSPQHICSTTCYLRCGFALSGTRENLDVRGTVGGTVDGSHGTVY